MARKEVNIIIELEELKEILSRKFNANIDYLTYEGTKVIAHIKTEDK